MPGWARPRGGQPGIGTAVTRTTPPYRDGGYYGRYYDPYWVYPGWGYGPGYYNYSPYMFGLGYGIGFPFMFDPWYSDPWYGYGDPFMYGGGGGYVSQGYSSTDDQGSLRLKVKPREAKVYVDGYLVGSVDEMDGVFQKLPLNAGRHKVEVKADGFAPEQFDVMITPGETSTFEGTLKKIQQ